MKDITDPPAIVEREEGRVRVPLAVLIRLERLEAELEVIRATAHQHGEEVAHHGKRLDDVEVKTHGHTNRIAQVELDVDELQRRKATMLSHLEEMRRDVAGLFDALRPAEDED